MGTCQPYTLRLGLAPAFPNCMCLPLHLASLSHTVPENIPCIYLAPTSRRYLRPTFWFFFLQSTPSLETEPV